MAYQNKDNDPACRVEVRGVWHRPNVTNEETSLAGIRSVLDKFSHAGINLVFLEVFYHGMTVFKTPTVEYYTGFEAYDYDEYDDYLSAFVSEAKKRNIEVHAWVEDYYIGVKRNRFVNNCSQWLLLNSKGEYHHSEGAAAGGYIFLDPANAEVRKFLVDFYNEILTRFPDIKGLNLDYIRYPVSSRSDDTGFTKTAMKQFAEQEGFELADDSIATFIAKLNSTGTYGKFTDFRAEAVTTFVEDIHNMLKEKHPRVLLSTAIFPQIKESYEQKKQDFRTWLRNNYLDIVTPMAYYDSDTTLRNALETMIAECENTYCYAGLSSTFHNLSNEAVLSQIKVCKSVDADGFVFFGSQSVLGNQDYISLMHNEFGTRANWHITPHSNMITLMEGIASPLIEYLMERAENGEEREGDILQLKAALDEIIELGEESQSALDEAENKLELLVKYNLTAYVSPVNLERAKDELSLLHRYVSIYRIRMEIKEVLPENQPTTDKNDPPPEVSTLPIEPEDPTLPNTDGTAIAIVATAAVAATTATIIIKKRKRH